METFTGFLQASVLHLSRDKLWFFDLDGRSEYVNSSPEKRLPPYLFLLHVCHIKMFQIKNTWPCESPYPQERPTFPESPR